MPSLRSRLLVAYLRATQRKAPYLDVRVLHARIAEERRNVRVRAPRGFRSESVAGLTVHTAVSKRGGRSRQPILYLHGGCFVFEIASHHYRFCQSLADALDCNVVIPIYPLAPESDALAIQKSLLAVVSAHGPFSALAGDSAGAGLALALAQRMESAPPLVLLSPWLDIALENPEVEAVDARDPWLSRPGMQECGRMYAGELPVSDPRVSPIHGALDPLPPISIFIGTRDLLLPDARKLQARAPDRVALVEYSDMVHDFMLVDILPEARRAFADIVAALRAEDGS